jgi:hypothetical protein
MLWCEYKFKSIWVRCQVFACFSEECTLKLSNTKRILSNFGYLASSNLRNSIYSLLLCLSLTSGIASPVCSKQRNSTCIPRLVCAFH